MNVKLFEVRDEGTTIPVLALKTAGNREPSQAEAWLWEQAGFYGMGYVLLVHLDRMQIQYDPYKWDPYQGRTMREVHNYLQNHWNELQSSDVIDVQFILGETKAPKVSERLREMVR